ncbi:hypothetical protein VNI00_016650 [Paramarasmius palmivorus]|uniref:Zn(2)-C6 fungal-type domain-containing protein n=1 Tax=Paramarasmius palmivorus TaxID=297713 RepID=A0AAW0BE26_9AGAR
MPKATDQSTDDISHLQARFQELYPKRDAKHASDWLIANKDIPCDRCKKDKEECKPRTPTSTSATQCSHCAYHGKCSKSADQKKDRICKAMSLNDKQYELLLRWYEGSGMKHQWSTQKSSTTKRPKKHQSSSANSPEQRLPAPKSVKKPQYHHDNSTTAFTAKPRRRLAGQGRSPATPSDCSSDKHEKLSQPESAPEDDQRPSSNKTTASRFSPDAAHDQTSDCNSHTSNTSDISDALTYPPLLSQPSRPNDHRKETTTYFNQSLLSVPHGSGDIVSETDDAVHTENGQANFEEPFGADTDDFKPPVSPFDIKKQSSGHVSAFLEPMRGTSLSLTAPDTRADNALR